MIRAGRSTTTAPLKVGYTAPGVRGQSAVISEALANAEVDAATIDLIEAHGTGTALGDAAELAALQQGVRRGRPAGRDGPGIGQDQPRPPGPAAGVTGLIKAALALEHGRSPRRELRRPQPSARPGRQPFGSPTSLEEWPRRDHPRRAGVSAFGIGGTNAHVVLEEAGAAPAVASAPRQRPQLVVLSARTEAAADARQRSWPNTCATHPALDLADVAHTLQTGRREFEHRRALVGHDVTDVVSGLTEYESQRLLHAPDTVPGRGVGLVLAGVGEQYPGMAAGSTPPSRCSPPWSTSARPC